MGFYNTVSLCELFSYIDWIWLSIAVVLSMLIGALWYGILFPKAWMRSNNINIDENLTLVQQIIPFVGQLVAVFLFAVYIFIAVQINTWLLIFGVITFMGWQKVTLKYRIVNMKKYIMAACIDVFYFAIVSAVCIAFGLI